MKTIFIVLIGFLLLGNAASAKTTETTADGNWTNASIWNNGVPVAGDSIRVKNLVTMNTDITLSGSGSLTIDNSGSLIDAPGGSSFDLTVENSAKLTLNGNLTIEGKLEFKNNSVINLNACDTLVCGEAVIQNNADFNIASCAVWIINGDLTLENNIGIDADGFIQVNGNVESKNNATVVGNVNLSSTGTINQSNSSNIFGSTADCNSGPCFFGTGFPLSIELVNFETSIGNNHNVSIRWEVYDEDEVLFYLIEKSIGGLIWTKLSMVESDGFEYNNYQISDEVPAAQLTYYRLKIIESNGQEVHSNIELVESKADNAGHIDIQVYPNPAHDFVKISGQFSNYQIRSFDGKLLLSGQNQEVNLSELSAGMYFVNIQKLDGLMEVKTLVLR